MAENSIELRNIRSLSGMNFFIPDYQRGYRWGEDEVIKMLNDFKEFYKRIKLKKDSIAPGEFYCLQPIVVKKKSWIDGEGNQVEGYEVIDGQQRLTTLFLLLKNTEDLVKQLYRKFSFYTIKYETRWKYDSQKFLENITTATTESANEFIDFYYMKKVYDAIEKWMSENEDYDRNIVDLLLKQEIDEENGQDIEHNVRVIWYEVAEDEKTSSIDIFTRLNIGKIPLTNAELIKALLLRKGNFGTQETTLKQIQISAVWDQIEQKLQDDSFWYFIYNPNKDSEYDNRIEFIFDLISNKHAEKDPEKHFTFNFFNQMLADLNKDGKQQQQAVEKTWDKVKEVFQTLQEWYEDRDLYHYIGFLIENGTDINTLKSESLTRTKKDFLEKYIHDEISKIFKGVDVRALTFGNSKVKTSLLFFNVLTALQSEKSDMRFPFNKYKLEKWDIEHISSQTEKTVNKENRQYWVDDMLKFFTGSTKAEKVSEYLKNLSKEIDELTKALENEKDETNKVRIQDKLTGRKNLHSMVTSIKNLVGKDGKIDGGAFDEVYKVVQDYFREGTKSEDKDSISNLTLLDAATNRAYGNAFFPIKRNWIMDNDSKGIFVPIVTKNVFLKYYSKAADNLMYWTESDAQCYLDSLDDTIDNYLNSKKDE